MRRVPVSTADGYALWARTSHALSLAMLVSACGTADLIHLGAGPPSPTTPTRRVPESALATRDWVIQIGTDARAGAVHVRIAMPHGDFDSWALAPRSGAVSAVAARDARGPVPVDRTGDRSFVLRAGGSVTAPLELSYDVLPDDSPAAQLPFEVTPDRASFSGASVLLIPSGHASERLDVRLELLPSKDFHERAASSLGPKAEIAARVSFEELASAAFVFGSLGLSTFSAPEGRDHAAWLGYFSFDPRWASAEAAGVRTMADRWLGLARPPEDPSVGLVFVATRGHARELSIRPALRGAVVQADVSAPWSARARLDVTRLFVQRTLGPAISLRADGCAEPAGAIWFDEGLAHAVALDVLRDAGILSNDEIIAEVNSWLAEEVLSPHANIPLANLCALVSSSGEVSGAARRLIAVRGALLGLSLSDPSDDVLGPSIRDLLKLASSSAQADQPMAALFEAASKRGSKRASGLQAALTSGAEIALAQGGLGPCAELTRRDVHPFALGFTVAEAGGGGAIVEEVLGRSNAASAGVRPGDAIITVDYAPGWTSVPVRLQVRRGAATKKLEFLPQGAGKRGRAFRAVRSPACAG